MEQDSSTAKHTDTDFQLTSLDPEIDIVEIYSIDIVYHLNNKEKNCGSGSFILNLMTASNHNSSKFSTQSL